MRHVHMHLYPPMPSESFARLLSFMPSATQRTHLRSSALRNRWWAIFILDRAAARATSLNTLDDAVR